RRPGGRRSPASFGMGSPWCGTRAGAVAGACGSTAASSRCLQTLSAVAANTDRYADACAHLGGAELVSVFAARRERRAEVAGRREGARLCVQESPLTLKEVSLHCLRSSSPYPCSAAPAWVHPASSECRPAPG